MSVSGLVALIACLASVFAKIIFSFRIKSLEKLSEIENETYQKAKNELHAAMQTQKRLEAENKQLEARRGATQRNIKNIQGTLEELQTRKREDDAVRAYQKELLSKSKSS